MYRLKAILMLVRDGIRIYWQRFVRRKPQWISLRMDTMQMEQMDQLSEWFEWRKNNGI